VAVLRIVKIIERERTRECFVVERSVNILEVEKSYGIGRERRPEETPNNVLCDCKVLVGSLECILKLEGL